MRSNTFVIIKVRTFPLVPFRPFADSVKISRRRVRVPNTSLLAAGALVFPFLRRTRFHSDVDVAGVAGRKRIVSIEGSVRGTRVTAEVAFEPLRCLEFSRFILFLQVQRLLRQGIFPSGVRETL